MLGLVLLFAFAVYGHGRLAVRVQRIFRQTPLIYSRLGIPESVDLRAAFEHPRFFYLALTLAGTGLRIVLVLVLLLFFETAKPALPWLPRLVLLVPGLLLLERLACRRRKQTPIGRIEAWALWFVAGLARLVPGRRQSDEPRFDDRLATDIVTKIDGEDVFTPSQRRFLSGLLSLRRRTVRNAMVGRDRMVSVSETWSVSRAADALRNAAYARVPVVAKGSGDIIGLVHTKDLLLLLHSHQHGAFVKSVMRDVVFVPSTLRLDRLLRQFQRDRVHIAVVQDEYGETCGLITTDDIIRAALKPEPA